MNIAEAKQQIKDTVDAYLDRDETGAYEIPPQAQRPLFLLGAPGIGKTAVMGQVARELGIGLVSYSMTHHTRQSALGLPFIVRKEYDGREFDISEYTMSEIIASMYDYMERTGHERGILFLDEINCVSETLYPSMLQFLQFKTFGRHKVPDGWVVVCAGNPPEYNKSVYEFDIVTLDRLRKIDIQPDLDAWLDYARATGVHPAVMSYLQVKENQFYSIESAPSGKSFVTARGWDDLSRIIKLFEKKGKKVDAALVGQFVQDDEIAERFTQYYLLFSKYRSDYQIDSILAGEAAAQIRQRAERARLDERFALVRLLIDALDSTIAGTMETERAVACERDALRAVKDAVIGGASAVELVENEVARMLGDVNRRLETDSSGEADVRPERRAISALRECVLACEQARTTSGPKSFDVMSSRYAQDAATLREGVEAATAKLDNAFAFVGDIYGDGREMSAFVADLAARPAIAQFIAKFGNAAYAAYRSGSGQLRSEDALLARIDELDLDAAAAEQAQQTAARSCAGCCAC